MASPSSAEVGVDPIPELVRLGEQLSQARERAGLSLDELARRLRVEPRLLQALEAGHHNQLPEGVFIVALARRITGSLNVDLEEAIQNVRESRLMAYRPSASSSAEPQPSLPRRTPQAPPPPPRLQPRPRRRPARAFRPWPVAALLAACGAVTAAAWLLLAPQGGRPPATPAAKEPAPPLPNPTTPTAAKTPGKRILPNQQSAKPNQQTSPTAPEPSQPSDANTLRLVAREPSWVEVRDDKGRTLFEGTLSTEKRFPLGPGVEVIAGRPYAVQAAIGSSPLAPLGGVSDIRWQRFSPKPLTPKAAGPSTPRP